MPEARHDDISPLLPWYVNGTLQATEQAMVEQHLAQCDRCREEAAGLRALAAVLQAESPEPRFDLYARTLDRIDRAEASRPLARVRALLAPVPRFALATMAAQLVVIAALAVLLTARPYATLSEGPRPSGPVAEFQVVFQAQTPASQVQGALLALNARIIDGPTSLGVYRLAVPLEPAGPSAEDILLRLRSTRGVEFAEIIGER